MAKANSRTTERKASRSTAAAQRQNIKVGGVPRPEDLPDPDGLTRVVLAKFGRQYLLYERNLEERVRADVARHRAEEQEREDKQKALEAERERKEREGVTLKGKRLWQAEKLVGDVNLAAVAVYGLATTADTNDLQERTTALVSLENLAKVICRKCDVMSELLGDVTSGNFREEFSALTPDLAEAMEREECEVENA